MPFAVTTGIVPNALGNFDITPDCGGETPVGVYLEACAAPSVISSGSPPATPYLRHSRGLSDGVQTVGLSIANLDDVGQSSTGWRRHRGAVVAQPLLYISDREDNLQTNVTQARLVSFGPDRITLDVTEIGQASTLAYKAVAFFGTGAQAHAFFGATGATYTHNFGSGNPQIWLGWFDGGAGSGTNSFAGLGIAAHNAPTSTPAVAPDGKQRVVTSRFRHNQGTTQQNATVDDRGIICQLGNTSLTALFGVTNITDNAFEFNDVLGSGVRDCSGMVVSLADDDSEAGVSSWAVPAAAPWNETGYGFQGTQILGVLSSANAENVPVLTESGGHSVFAYDGTNQAVAPIVDVDGQGQTVTAQILRSDAKGSVYETQTAGAANELVRWGAGAFSFTPTGFSVSAFDVGPDATPRYGAALIINTGAAPPAVITPQNVAAGTQLDDVTIRVQVAVEPDDVAAGTTLGDVNLRRFMAVDDVAAGTQLDEINVQTQKRIAVDKVAVGTRLQNVNIRQLGQVVVEPVRVGTALGNVNVNPQVIVQPQGIGVGNRLANVSVKVPVEVLVDDMQIGTVMGGAFVRIPGKAATAHLTTVADQIRRTAVAQSNRRRVIE